MIFVLGKDEAVVVVIGTIDLVVFNTLVVGDCVLLLLMSVVRDSVDFLAISLAFVSFKVSLGLMETFGAVDDDAVRFLV